MARPTKLTRRFFALAALWVPALASLTVGSTSLFRGPNSFARARAAAARIWIEDCSACAPLLHPFELVAFSMDPAVPRPESGDFAVTRFFQARHALSPARLHNVEDLRKGSFRHHLVVMTDDGQASRRAAELGGTIVWRNSRGAALVRTDP